MHVLNAYAVLSVEIIVFLLFCLFVFQLNYQGHSVLEGKLSNFLFLSVIIFITNEI